MAINERFKEFVFEGKHWYDLRRMQYGSGQPFVYRKYLPLVGVLKNIDEQKHKILRPVDIGTMTADPTLTGDLNPGYTGT